jgi:GT2 family glycosyltransferase
VNQGVSLASGEFVTIANNDIRVPPNWLSVSQEIMKDPKVGSVHFRMIPYEEPWLAGSQTWLGGKERWCSSSFFTIRKDAFQGYDPTFKQGGYDDYDHHFRMRRKGWIQAYTNKASYQHADSLTYQSIESPEKRSERDVKNREYFKTKHGEYPDEQFARLFPDQMTVPWRPFP